MKRHILVFGLAVSILAGCGGMQTVTKNDLLVPEDFIEKECYSFVTDKKLLAANVQSATPIAIIAAFTGPLAPVVMGIGSVAQSAAMQAAMETKCGLTVEEAIIETYQLAFYEDSGATFTQKKKNDPISISAKPYSSENEKCAFMEVGYYKYKARKKVVSAVEVCKDENGVPVITRENVEAELAALKTQPKPPIEPEKTM